MGWWSLKLIMDDFGWEIDTKCNKKYSSHPEGFLDVMKDSMLVNSSGKFSNDSKTMNGSNCKLTTLTLYILTTYCSYLLILIIANESLELKRILYFFEFVDELSSSF